MGSLEFSGIKIPFAPSGFHPSHLDIKGFGQV